MTATVMSSPTAKAICLSRVECREVSVVAIQLCLPLQALQRQSVILCRSVQLGQTSREQNSAPLHGSHAGVARSIRTAFVRSMRAQRTDIWPERVRSWPAFDDLRANFFRLFQRGVQPFA